MWNIFLFLILFTANVFSYPHLYVGTVESRYWSDVWENFRTQYPLKVYAGGGTDGEYRSILIEIKNDYGEDYRKQLNFRKCSEKSIKKKRCYENGYSINKDYDTLLYILKKSIEWSKIAKENNVEKVSKNIQYEGKNIRSPFGGGNVSFYAQGTYQSDLILPLYFPSSRSEDRYYSLQAQENFLELLTNATETIERSIKENKKSEDLFN